MLLDMSNKMHRYSVSLLTVWLNFGLHGCVSLCS